MVNKLRTFFTSTQFHLFLIFIGVSLRLKHYLENRSLWLDESYISFEIVNRSISDHFFGLRTFYAQAASPLFFLLTERLAVDLFGISEYSLRLFPLVSSILSIFIFIKVLKSKFDGRVFILAVALFVFSEQLVYYAAEVKRYSSDVLTALVVYWTYFYAQSLNFNRGGKYLFGLVGALAMWMSYTSLFVLAGIFITVMFIEISKKDYKKLFRFLVPCLVWLWSFILLYKISFSWMTKSEYLVYANPRGFSSFSFFSLDHFLWSVGAIYRYFEDPLGLVFVPLMIILFIIGCWQLYKKNKELLMLLVSPLLIVYVAAQFSKYPFYGRFVLFTLPFSYLIIAQGVIFIVDLLKGRVQFLMTPLLIGAVLFVPIKTSIYYLKHAHLSEDNRQAMTFLKEHVRSGDQMIMNVSAQFPYFFYSRMLDLNPTLVKYERKNPPAESLFIQTVGRIADKPVIYNNQEHMLLRFDRFIYGVNYQVIGLKAEKGFGATIIMYEGRQNQLQDSPRSWVYLSHMQDDHSEFLLKLLDQWGTRELEWRGEKASMHLYHFNKE